MGMKEGANVAGHSSSELQRVREERNELEDKVESFEQQLTQVHSPGGKEHTHTHTHAHTHTVTLLPPPQIQQEVKSLTRDRDNFKLLYEQVRDAPTHVHTCTCTSVEYM